MGIRGIMKPLLLKLVKWVVRKWLKGWHLHKDPVKVRKGGRDETN